MACDARIISVRLRGSRHGLRHRCNGKRKCGYRAGGGGAGKGPIMEIECVFDWGILLADIRLVSAFNSVATGTWSVFHFQPYHSGLILARWMTGIDGLRVGIMILLTRRSGYWLYQTREWRGFSFFLFFFKIRQTIGSDDRTAEGTIGTGVIDVIRAIVAAKDITMMRISNYEQS